MHEQRKRLAQTKPIPATTLSKTVSLGSLSSDNSILTALVETEVCSLVWGVLFFAFRVAVIPRFRRL